MPIVSSRVCEGFNVDAVWEHGPGEKPRFRVHGLSHDGAFVGEWIVTGAEISDQVALDIGEEMTLLEMFDAQRAQEGSE